MATYRVEIRVEIEWRGKRREVAVTWRALELPGFAVIRHDVVRPPFADEQAAEVHAIIAINTAATAKGVAVSAPDIEVSTTTYTDGVPHQSAPARAARADLFAQATKSP